MSVGVLKTIVKVACSFGLGSSIYTYICVCVWILNLTWLFERKYLARQSFRSFLKDIIIALGKGVTGLKDSLYLDLYKITFLIDLYLKAL